jgi:TPP-dependent pyruvate/acetoin dehydrogenase alpha subunit
MATTSEKPARPSEALSSNQLKEMYYFARLARAIEERLVILFRQSQVIGGLYRSLGQEGESVATAYALARTDAVLPLIRNMGALTTMGVRPREIFRQYMAKATSNSRGRDLNIHIVHLPDWIARRGIGAPGLKNYGTGTLRLKNDGTGTPRLKNDSQPVIVGPISMLGDSIPVAAGIAMGARMRGRDLVAMAWIGDGATSTGAFHEGINFAAVQKIPLVIIAEDNKYAYSTPIAKQMAIGRIDERAASYGIPHQLVDGNDMLAVYDVAKGMVDRARSGGGASLIGVDTMRMQGHAQHDDARYVPKTMTEEWAQRDPLPRFRKVLRDRDAATEKDIDDIDTLAKDYAATEADLAVKDPMPDPATVTRGVYAGDDFAEPKLEFVRSPFAE